MLQGLKGFDLCVLVVNLRYHICLKVAILFLESVSNIGVFNHQVLEAINLFVLNLLIRREQLRDLD